MNAAEFARSQGWEVGTVLENPQHFSYTWTIVSIGVEHIEAAVDGAERISALRVPCLGTWTVVAPDTLTPRIEAREDIARRCDEAVAKWDDPRGTPGAHGSVSGRTDHRPLCQGETSTA